MTDRTVAVNLTAQVANYITGVRSAASETRKLAADSKSARAALDEHNAAMTKLGVGFLAVGTAAAGGLALVVKATADYGAKMAQLQSLSHASANEMQKLSDAAMTQGQAFGFSATQVADAEIELTKAGVSVQAQLGGALKGALTLAAAGQMDVAGATEIATVAMTQFGLKAGDVPHLADLLSAGADKALGSVADLGEGLKNGGLQAHNMGLSIDDTVGVLSAFANQGILGAEAGTQLRSMFLRLQNPVASSKKVMQEYGITINDASGKFVGITQFAGELHDKLGGLTQAQRNSALATMFGSHAIVGATALYQYGAKGIGSWIKAVNDSGFASAQAAGKMNSLQGDATKLAAAFQTDLIKSGGSVDGMLRSVVQSTTTAVETFGKLPAPVQEGILVVGGLTAAVGLLGGMALIAVPKIAEFKLSLDRLGTTGRGVAGMIGKGSALALGVAALTSLLAAAADQGQATAQQIELAGQQVTGGSWKGVDKLFGAAGNAAGAKSALDGLASGNFLKNNAGFYETLDKWTLGLTHLGDVYKSNAGAFDALGQQLGGLAKQNYSSATRSFNGLVKQMGGGAETARELLQVMPAYRDQLVTLAGKAHVAATDQNLLAIAQGKGSVSAKVAAQAARDAAAAANQQAAQLAKLTGSGDDATTSMKNLHDALAGLGSTELDARSAARDFQQAIDDATAAAAKNGKTLNINTQAGRDNASALDAIASKATASAAAFVNNGGSAAGAAKLIADGRSAYIKAAESMGLSKSAANRLADALHLIPGDVNSIIHVTGADGAEAKIAAIKAAMNNLDGTAASVYVSAVAAGVDTGIAAQSAKNALLSRAAGGPIDGPGPKGVDSVPALLAPGEHVLTTHDVDRLGGQAGVYRFRSALASGTVQGFAAGGAASAIASDRESYYSAARRGNYSDPVAYIDELRSLSQDTTAFSSSARGTYARLAGSQEAAMIKLSKASSAASTKLTDLKSSAQQLHDSVKSAIAGGFTASAAGQAQVASGWAYQDGIRYRTYTTGTTASSLTSYYSAGAAQVRTFAGQLKQLAAKGINGNLLSEIAGYGTEQGSPIAAALLSATSSQLKSINANYSAIGAYASQAGTTVENANYSKQIAAADKNAASINRQIAKKVDELKKVIGHGLHIKGYATGTMNASEGLHWVGENGPELMWTPGGAHVYPPQWLRSNAGSGPAQFPSHVTLVDQDGSVLAKARVVAKQEIAKNEHSLAVTAGGGTW